MAKTTQLKNKHSLKELQQSIKKSKDPDQKTRLRAIISVKNNLTRKRVSQNFSIREATLRSWIRAYNKDGIEALQMSKGGRPEGNPRWDNKVFEKLIKEIDKGGYWSIPRMQDWLSKNHEVNIPEQTVWYRIDQLGYSYKGARPHPVKGDEEKQKNFKKRGLLHSWSH
jgi:transposase